MDADGVWTGADSLDGRRHGYDTRGVSRVPDRAGCDAVFCGVMLQTGQFAVSGFPFRDTGFL